MNKEDLSGAIQEVLGNSSYRDTARRFQRTIAQTHGLDRAADVLERTFQLVDESGGGGLGEAPGHWCSLTYLKRQPILLKEIQAEFTLRNGVPSEINARFPSSAEFAIFVM